jgi:hypothetical protein
MDNATILIARRRNARPVFARRFRHGTGARAFLFGNPASSCLVFTKTGRCAAFDVQGEGVALYTRSAPTRRLLRACSKPRGRSTFAARITCRSAAPRRVQAAAGIALWIATELLLSACTTDSAVHPAAVARPPRQLPSAPQAVDPTRPDRVRAEIRRWFAHAGYKGFQVEALATHAKVESGFRPCAAAGGRRYTYQWSGERLRRLGEFAGARGACPPLDKQLAFADYELRSVPAYSCFWAATTESAATSALRRGFGRGSC